jgi:ribonuclease BN (tRNA processing enzyme)
MVYIIIALMDSLHIRTVYWNTLWKIPNTTWTICGYSRSNFRTGFYIKELDMMLDAGPQNFNHPGHIFVTHGHADHIANIPFTLMGDVQVTVYSVKSITDTIQKYVKSLYLLNWEMKVDEEDRIELSNIKFEAVEAGKKRRIVTNKQKMEIEMFDCDHSVTTVGYGFGLIKNKIKDEYKGLNGKQIVELKKQNKEITNEIIEKKLAYVCDTSIKVLETSPEIFDYGVVFIECTFLYEDEIERAIDRKHINFHQLLPYIKDHPQVYFVLFHFSLMYKDTEIIKYLDDQIDKHKINNMKYWVTYEKTNINI